jgi:hypothetical protein
MRETIAEVRRPGIAITNTKRSGECVIPVAREHQHRK